MRRRQQPVEQYVAQCRRFRQDGRDIDVANGQFFGHDSAGQMIRAGTAIALGQRHRAQTNLRGLVEDRRQQWVLKWLQAFGLEGDRFDFLGDKVPDRIAELQLLCTKMKIVHVCQSVPVLIVVRPPKLTPPKPPRRSHRPFV